MSDKKAAWAGLVGCAAVGSFAIFCNNLTQTSYFVGLELSYSICEEHTLLSSAVVAASAAACYYDPRAVIAGVKDFVRVNVHLADKASEIIGLKAFAEITGMKALGYNAIMLADKVTEKTGLKAVGKMALQKLGLFGTNDNDPMIQPILLREPREPQVAPPESKYGHPEASAQRKRPR